MGRDFEFSRCDPTRKLIPAEMRRLMQKRRRSSKKCVLRSLARNQKPKKIKNLLNVIFCPLCRGVSAGPIFTVFGMWGHTTDVISGTEFQVDCAGG